MPQLHTGDTGDIPPLPDQFFNFSPYDVRKKVQDITLSPPPTSCIPPYANSLVAALFALRTRAALEPINSTTLSLPDYPLL